MAKFRDMKEFVKIVKDFNDKESSDDDVNIFVKEFDAEYTLWITRNDAKAEFAKRHGHKKAQEVYEDVTSKKYGYINVHTVNIPNQDKRLWVGSAGRSLLENGGVERAWADDNKNIATIVLSTIGGFIGGAGLVIAVMSLNQP